MFYFLGNTVNYGPFTFRTDMSHPWAACAPAWLEMQLHKIVNFSHYYVIFSDIFHQLVARSLRADCVGGNGTLWRSAVLTPLFVLATHAFHFMHICTHICPNVSCSNNLPCHVYPTDLSRTFTLRFVLAVKTLLHLAWEEEKEVKPCEIRHVLLNSQ